MLDKARVFDRVSGLSLKSVTMEFLIYLRAESNITMSGRRTTSR
jgi:hypothetical protein